jgi:hypothetical protein
VHYRAYPLEIARGLAYLHRKQVGTELDPLSFAKRPSSVVPEMSAHLLDTAARLLDTAAHLLDAVPARSRLPFLWKLNSGKASLRALS